MREEEAGVARSALGFVRACYWGFRLEPWRAGSPGAPPEHGASQGDGEPEAERPSAAGRRPGRALHHCAANAALQRSQADVVRKRCSSDDSSSERILSGLGVASFPRIGHQRDQGIRGIRGSRAPSSVVQFLEMSGRTIECPPAGADPRGASAG